MGKSSFLKDSSGNKYDGKLEGKAGWVEGNFSKALKLNGNIPISKGLKDAGHWEVYLLANKGFLSA